MSKERSEYYQCTTHRDATIIKCYTPTEAQQMLERGVYKDMKMISIVKPVVKRERRRRRRGMNISETKPYYQPYSRFDLSLEGLNE